MHSRHGDIGLLISDVVLHHRHLAMKGNSVRHDSGMSLVLRGLRVPEEARGGIAWANEEATVLDVYLA